MGDVERRDSSDSRCGVDFTKMPAKYWSNTTKASYLQRRIIVYSIMYYENDESCVSDKYYDDISHQLVKIMQQSTKEEMEATTYWYAMHDFDGSTGFYIQGRLTKKDNQYLTMIANKVHDQWKREGGTIAL